MFNEPEMKKDSETKERVSSVPSLPPIYSPLKSPVTLFDNQDGSANNADAADIGAGDGGHQEFKLKDLSVQEYNASVVAAKRA